MRAIVFSHHPFERPFLERANAAGRHELVLVEARLDPTTVPLAGAAPAVAILANDRADEEVLSMLHAGGTRLLALRSAGFNHVDLAAAERLGFSVLRVPAYSPYSVAEHAVALMLSLNRRIHRAYPRVREGNFSLEGLMGFDMHGKTAGVIGTGKIGAALVRILLGFGCHVLASDPQPDASLAQAGVRYVSPDELFATSDIISLNCPLTPQTRHLVNARTLALMKPDAMLINTGRGALIDTKALIAALKQRTIGYVGLDVYEEEAGLFFHDMSDEIIQDDVFVRLMTFPNVLVTGHQGFLTREAITAIAETTIANLSAYEDGELPEERVVRLP